MCIPLPPTHTLALTLNPQPGQSNPHPTCHIPLCAPSLDGKRNQNLAWELWAAMCMPEGGRGPGVGFRPYLEDKGVEVVGHLQACAPAHLLDGRAGSEQLRL